MKFELLANEIILDLFEYIPIFDLFHSFLGLNKRFNQLLCHEYQKLHFDLLLFSKTKINYLFENVVPLIIDQIISVRLSNENKTPQQVEHFLSHHFRLRQFTHLQSIWLSSVRAQGLLDKIILECSYLPCLTHLTIVISFHFTNQNDAIRFLNRIWSLKNLIYLHYSILFSEEYHHPIPTVVSTSLRYLKVENTTYSGDFFTRLCQHTPNLQSLSVNISTFNDSLDSLPYMFSMNRLIVYYYGSLETLLEKMPNLSYLRYNTPNIYISGHQWERIIRKYLPKLKIFHLKMEFEPLNNNENPEVQLDEIIDTYRTKFWIDEHQWFVRCHWYPSKTSYPPDCFILFTLPYTFPNDSIKPDWSLKKSTCSTDVETLTYDRVSHLIYGSSIFSSLIASRVDFSNMQYATLELSFIDEFLMIVSKLDQLTFLGFYKGGNINNFDNIQSKLQLTLDRAPRLRCLKIDTCSVSSYLTVLTKLTSISIHDLIFSDDANDYEDDICYYFNDEQCIELGRSPLGKQCEYLSIEVNNPKCIVDIINNLFNLQTLIVRCTDYTGWYLTSSRASKKDEIVGWLKETLPSTCTITTNGYNADDIQIWIR